MLTPTQLTEIRERCDKATPGPWVLTADSIEQQDGDIVLNTDHDLIGCSAENDAEFCAQARQDIPALLAHIDHLQSENEAMKEDLDYLEKLEGHIHKSLPCHGAHSYFENIEGAKIDLKKQREKIDHLNAQLEKAKNCMTPAMRMQFEDEIENGGQKP